MLHLLVTACLLQDPALLPAPTPAPDPRELFSEWARRLHRTPVLHLTADGVLVTSDKEKPDASVRWTFRTEVWMAKGGKVDARTVWTGPRPEQGEPETFTAIALSNGARTWQGFEGASVALTEAELPSPRFVPYPLPEIFGLFDGALETDLPEAKVSLEFDWGEPVRTLPTVIVVDPAEPKTEPAFWYGFAEKELAGWCSMNPQRLGGDILRGKVKKLEWLERLPEKAPPRFEPNRD